jgi:hypothetical protein
VDPSSKIGQFHNGNNIFVWADKVSNRILNGIESISNQNRNRMVSGPSQSKIESKPIRSDSPDGQNEGFKIYPWKQ